MNNEMDKAIEKMVYNGVILPYPDNCNRFYVTALYTLEVYYSKIRDNIEVSDIFKDDAGYYANIDTDEHGEKSLRLEYSCLKLTKIIDIMSL